MALINRVARLFAADAHAVIDKLEEPDLLAKQAQRDMQNIVRDTELAVATQQQQVAVLESSVADVERDLKACAEELDVCFTASDEDLARTVLRRRLQLERREAHLRKQHESSVLALADLEQRLREQRLALEEVEQKIGVLEVATPRPSAPVSTITADEVEVAFLAEKQRRAPK